MYKRQVKNGDFAAVTEEIRAIKQAAGSHVLKVIVETCYLTEAEKVALCKCVTDAGADYIKTSTGFGTGGATLEDIALFKANVGPNVRIKAAGGVRTAEAVEAYLEAGCDLSLIHIWRRRRCSRCRRSGRCRRSRR